MAKNGKTKLILTVIIGLFGVMCFGFALTVTDKYKTARDKVANLERKFEAGKNELLKVPELKEKVIVAEEEAKGAREELESVQEELDETSEELDEVTEEFENLKSGIEEGTLVAEEGELTSELEEAKGQIESLSSDLVSAERTISDLRARRGTVSGSEVVGFTFDGLYNVDPKAKKQDIKEVHRGLAYHRRVESIVETVTGEGKDPVQMVKKHLDTINARISELLTYASEKRTRRDRIGVNAYASGPTQKIREEQDKITNALNDVLENYTNIYKVISDCGLYTSWKRGFAKSSLSKRVSNYIGLLLSKNQSGEFGSDDRDVKLLLSKIQNEQKYFLN